MDRMNRVNNYWVLVIALTFVLAVVIDSFSGFQRECAQLQEDVLRLHILANSDSPEDQAVKLKVRDALLAQTGDLFYCAENLQDAKQAAAENLAAAEKIAEEVLRENGYDYQAHAEVTEMFFDTRVYDGFTMPAGRYQALRLTLGEGAGHNWWCVLYPPLCVGAASETVDNMETFTPGERRVLEAEPEYEVRFFLVELAGRVGEWFASLGQGKAGAGCCD